MAAYPSRVREHRPRRPSPIRADGFVVVVEPGDRIHFLDWGGRRVGPASCSSTGWPRAPGRGRRSRAGSSRRRADGRDGSPRPRPVGRPDRDRRYDLDGSPTTSSRSPRAPARSTTRHGGPRRPRVRGDRRRRRPPPGSASDAPGSSSSTAGWTTSARRPAMDVDEFLRGLDEPPEVMRSMTRLPRRPPGVGSGDAGTPTRSGRRGRRSSRRPPAGSSRRPGPTRSRRRVRTMFDYRPPTSCRRVTRRRSSPSAERPPGDDARRGVGDAGAGRASSVVDALGARPQPPALPAGRGRRRRSSAR